MFTATWPREVQALAMEFLINPVEIKFGDVNNLNANKDITQVIKVISEHEKEDTLQAVLKEINPSGETDQVPKTIIFVSRKHACDTLANKLWDMGYHVDSLHGDKQQFQRTRVMDQFKKTQLRILVATGKCHCNLLTTLFLTYPNLTSPLYLFCMYILLLDVAARGLDVKVMHLQCINSILHYTYLIHASCILVYRTFKW